MFSSNNESTWVSLCKRTSFMSKYNSHFFCIFTLPTQSFLPVSGQPLVLLSFYSCSYSSSYSCSYSSSYSCSYSSFYSCSYSSSYSCSCFCSCPLYLTSSHFDGQCIQNIGEILFLQIYFHLQCTKLCVIKG